MVRKILVISALLGLGFLAQAQAETLGKKLYIINQAHEQVVNQANDPSIAIQSVDRVELKAVDTEWVSVKKCDAGGCKLAIGTAVKLDDVSTANSRMASKTSKDFEDLASDCRVCVAPTQSDVGTYVNELKSTLKEMGKIK